MAVRDAPSVSDKLKTITVRLLESERTEWIGRANAAGLTLSTYLRYVMNNTRLTMTLETTSSVAPANLRERGDRAAAAGYPERSGRRPPVRVHNCLPGCELEAHHFGECHT